MRKTISRQHFLKLGASLGALAVAGRAGFSGGAEAAEPRKVYAHYMLGTYGISRTVAGFSQEVRLAKAAGIDGFALNAGPAWLSGSRYRENAAMLFSAAQSVGGFELFFSADANGGISASTIRDMASAYYSHPNHAKRAGLPILDTYIGQALTFGYSSPEEGWWRAVLKPLADAGRPVFFIPNFRPTTTSWDGLRGVYTKFPYLNGLHNFSSWAIGNDGMAHGVSWNRGHAVVSRERGKIAMAQVHPNYSAHVQRPSGRTNNNIFGNMAGGEGMQKLWRGIIADGPDLVQIVTWNDWLESTYIGPARSTPARNASANTRPHRAYRELSGYYARWFKTGTQPAITQDRVFFFYRSHSKNAVASGDPLGKPRRWDSVEDKLYATAMLESPARLTLFSGSATQGFDLPAGITNVSMFFRPGTQMVSLSRGGATIASASGAIPVSNTISTYNFNHCSGVLRA